MAIAAPLLGLRDMVVELVKGRKRRARKLGIVVAIMRRAIEINSVRDEIVKGSLIGQV